MLRRIAIAAVVTVLSWGSVYGEDGDHGLVVDGERAKGYVAHLSTDALEGRASCTEGYRKAADWVAGQLKAWGLEPAGEDGTYFQKVTIRGFDWNTGVPALEVGGRKFVFDDGDYSVLGESTAATTQQGEIVFVGYGIAAAEKGLDEYEAVDVKGKVVLVLKGSPKDAPQRQARFGPRDEGGEDKKDAEEWKQESTDLQKIKTAHEKGAAAVLLYDPAASSDDNARRRYSRGPQRGGFEPERKFLSFTIGESVFRAIMKQDPQESPRGMQRRIDNIGRAIKQKKAQSFKTGVRAVLKGYEVSQRYDEEHGNNVARNVLAKIEGTDPKLKHEYVLAGAHLDHIGVRGGYVCNGADDNASGSAVVMEVARVLREGGFKPKRTLIFCCWCGEERGLIGSIHYTNHPCDGVTMDKVVTYFNIDMVGMGKDLGAPGALNFPTIWDLIQRDQDAEILKCVKPSEGGPAGSDHTGFIRKGIEALALMSRGGVGHQDYHQPEDDTEKIEPEMLRLTGQFVLQGMVNLTNESEVNLLIDRRLQLYRGMRMRIGNFNPDLKDGQWKQIAVAQKTKEALSDAIHKRAKELLGGAKAESGDAAEKKSLARGTAHLQFVGDDTRLLELAVKFYAVGRIDVTSDDGAWVAEGRLTDAGKEALKTLEQNGVVVRLVSPGKDLIGDVLSAASKPFIVTGNYQIDEAIVDRLNSRGVLLGVDFDPQDVDGFLKRLQELKEQLGERGNLFAFLTKTEKLDEARRPLYLGLIDRGWTHNEIVGNREHRGLVGGGKLGTLGK